MTTETVLHIRTSIKDRQLGVYQFSEPEICIGRDASCQVVLDNQGVSRRHAIITIGDDGIRLADLQSSNGTYLNEKRIEDAPLRDGDVIRLNKFTLQVRVQQRGPTPAPAPDMLKSTEGQPARPQRVAGGEGTVLLGAGERARVLGESKQASRPALAQREAPAEGRSLSPFLLGALFGAVVTYFLMS
ncbi:MAG: pSer/pThr/pTyr-binding forkhead associated (FHA) protein [Halieaceae bacterium]|jgi:pSer/pThr/pTyr-binding forkhead associated (FHA) protein